MGIREQEVMNLQNDEYENLYFVDYRYTGSHRMGEICSQGESFFKFNSKELCRNSICWQCKRDLSEQKDDICSKCGWMRCPIDDACKCNKG